VWVWQNKLGRARLHGVRELKFRHGSTPPFAISLMDPYYFAMQDTQTHPSERSLSEHSIVIVGVGLIGGSIAAAVRQRFPDCQVVGIGRSAVRLQQAQDRGLLTSWSVDISSRAIPNNSLAIVCLPVDQIANAVRSLLKEGCELVTDAGSVKAAIYESLGSEFFAADAQHGFVGSHPIAGSEQSGFESADANLFLNRLCVVTTQTAATTNPEEANYANVNRVVAFWKSLGSTVHLMSPDEHDRVLALTSHLPHILSSVTAACVEPELLPFTGTGYRDTTRIAAGSASLWASILLGNAKHCVESIRMAEDHLRKFRDALVTGDSQVLEALWESAASQRRQLDRTRESASQKTKTT
jgi:prephenate dehydrogenase